MLFSTLASETIENRLDLTGALSNICSRQILAISDVDALRPEPLDLLVEAISKFRCEIIVGAGSGARRHVLPMPKFSFVATTSKPWLVDEQISRWCIPCEFAPYSLDEAAQIVMVIAREKDVPIDFVAAAVIAVRCRYKPGEARSGSRPAARKLQWWAMA